MECLGKVCQWNDQRGYGFIAALDAQAGNPRVFFHIRDYGQDGRRPELGELVKFTAVAGARPRASRVRRAVAPVASKRATPSPGIPSRVMRKGTVRPASGFALAVPVAIYVTLLALAVQSQRLPMELVFALAGINLVTILFYYGDKTAARRGEGRVSESTLHLLEFAGGWPGALLAQRRFDHKTTKASYRRAFWAVVALHCGALAVLAQSRLLG